MKTTIAQGKFTTEDIKHMLENIGDNCDPYWAIFDLKNQAVAWGYDKVKVIQEAKKVLNNS